MIVRRDGAALILTALVCVVALGGCRDATGPDPSFDSPASSDATAQDQSEMLRQAVAKANAGGRVFIVFDGQPDRKLAEEAGATVDYEYKIIPALAVRAPGQVISKLAGHGRVVAVEPDVRIQAVGGLPGSGALGEATPAGGLMLDYEAELAATWGVERIGAGLVHDDPAGNGGAGITVGVLDTGCDYTHPDLAANYAGGYDFVNNDAYPMDDAGHGTHVSGTIAAVKNGLGVVGVAPEVSLYCLKILDAGGRGDFSDAVAAIDWAVAKGLQVTNHSYSSSRNPGTATKTAFENAAAAGMISVASAGNSGTASGKGNTVAYPARYETVIAVAAVDAADARADFSSTGGAVELAAPGVLINSTVPGGSWATNSGTSMASPHVAGVAALILGDGTPAASVRALLQTTADDLGGSGRDNLYGFGLVRADVAVLGSAGNTSPTASFTFTCTALSCEFDASESRDSDGTIVEYAWDFGDGGTATGTEATTSHVYAAAGSYDAVLTVTDDAGADDTTSKSAVVTDGSAEVGGPAIALVALTGTGKFENELMVMDADGGNPTMLLYDNVDHIHYPSFSSLVQTTPGFTGRISFETRNDVTGTADAELRVVDFTIAENGSVITGITVIAAAADGGGWMSAWSPDGNWLAFVKNVETPDGLWIVDYRSGAPGAITQLLADPVPGDGTDDVGWPTWSPDGARLAFTWCEPLGGGDCESRIRIVSLHLSSGVPTVISGSETDVGLGIYGWALDWSRSGNFIAYKSGSAMRVLDVNGVNLVQTVGNTQWTESPTWGPQSENEFVFMNRHGKSGTGKRRIVSRDLATNTETILYERKGFHLHSPDWRR